MSTKMPLIALCGPKGSGKTTLAKLITEQFPYRRVSFATPIYMMLKTLLLYQGASEEEIEYLFTKGKEEKTPYLNGRSTRYALRTLGSEWGRNLIDINLWTEAWEVYYAKNGSLPTIIDDMRWVNESEMVKSYKGIRIRIERPGITLDPSHISETEQAKIEVDYTIINDGEPGDMLNKLNHFLRQKHTP